jgi:hypothetical protein
MENLGGDQFLLSNPKRQGATLARIVGWSSNNFAACLRAQKGLAGVGVSPTGSIQKFTTNFWKESKAW